MDQDTNGVGDGRTIGRRLRMIRDDRGKSLRVVAGLAGISASYLSQLESGGRALDRLSLIVALANALQIAPSELTRLPVPAPGNGAVDARIDAMRHVLMEVNHGYSTGDVVPVDVLRDRVHALIAAACLCQHTSVGAALPDLVRDMHASIGAGRDTSELLELAVLLHTQGTVAWLNTMGAPVDLRSQAVVLAARAAEDRDTPTALGLATVSAAGLMIMAGAFDLAGRQLDAVEVPTTTPEGMQLAGFRALRRSVLAAADSRPGDMAAPLEYATELAERTGEGNAFYLSFGPFSLQRFGMVGALEAGDHERAVSIARTMRLDSADTARQAYYWVDVGRALTRLGSRRRDDAVRALLRAERLSPAHVQRNPGVQSVLGELVARSKRDAIGRELRGMAYRAGLPV